MKKIFSLLTVIGFTVIASAQFRKPHPPVRQETKTLIIANVTTKAIKTPTLPPTPKKIDSTKTK